jgi:hypothetical protein
MLDLLGKLAFPTGMAEAVDSLAVGGITQEMGALFAGFFVIFMIIFLIVLIAAYIYSALALMAIAKRTDNEPAWLAWLPIGNMYLLSKIAKMHWWPILMLIPYFVLYLAGTMVSYLPNMQIVGLILTTLAMIFELVFAVYVLVWWWKVCEERNRPGWWILLSFIPVFGMVWIFVMMGILAWAKD